MRKFKCMKSLKIISFVFVFLSCNQVFYPKFLKKDFCLWETRRAAIEHYGLYFLKNSDFILIETTYVNDVYYGCFYVENSSFCFRKVPFKQNKVEFPEFSYEEFIVESLKNGNIDTLITLSKSLNHIVMPRTTLRFTISKNGEFAEYQMYDFTTKPNDINVD